MELCSIFRLVVMPQVTAGAAPGLGCGANDGQGVDRALGLALLEVAHHRGVRRMRDGRSVPVDLGFDPRVLHSLKDFGSSTRGGGGIKIGKIEINVTAKDADSFQGSDHTGAAPRNFASGEADR